MGTPIDKSLSFLKTQRSHIPTIVTCLVVVFIYVWYCSYEQWTSWPTHTLFYDSLGNAFANGNIALEETVNPDILALDNPYDPKQRKRNDVEFPMDYSLYDGKYYLYFGPVPGLPVAALKSLGAGTIGDQYPVFLGILGLFLFQSLLIIYIRNRFFPDIPSWMVPLAIFFAGLILPFTRMLTDGRVYETAVSTGQFFFLAGLYCIVTTLGTNKSGWRFVAAGIFWGLALGSRITQLLPVTFVSIMLVFFAVRTYIQTRSFATSVSPLILVGLPLVLGVTALGWYNWARFGNVFETGISYQLTTPDLQGYRKVLFSPIYILPNAYNYVAAPPKVNPEFPYLQSVRGNGHRLFPAIELPKVYYTRSMTGILYTSPFVVFAALAVLAIPFLTKDVAKGTAPASQEDQYMLRWIILSLFGSFLIAFLLTLSYFWVEIRFLTDSLPSLILLSIIGFWLGCRFLSRWPLPYRVFAAVGSGLMLVSVLVSNLILFANQATVYQDKFPEMWNFLSDISARIAALIP